MNGSTMGDDGYSGNWRGSRWIVVQQRRLPPGLPELAAAAGAEGYGMLEVLLREWEDATNRFDQPGESLLAAFDRDRLVGVAGLNRDPFADLGERAGRVRRLYVHPDSRRRGIGRALVEAIVMSATGHLDKLTVFTPDAVGIAFYEACGFATVAGLERRSHERSL